MALAGNANYFMAAATVGQRLERGPGQQDSQNSALGIVAVKLQAIK